METTFIYALCEPGTRRIRYIGKADKPKKRFKEHLRTSVKYKSYLGNWLRSLILRGEEPELISLREVPTESWQVAEERYIRIARGCGMALVNGTSGGEGNHNFSEEVRAKIAASNLGSKRTAKTRQLMSKLRKGTGNPFFGRTHSPSSLEKMRQIKLGKKSTAESRKKCSRSLKGRIFSPEHREKLRLAALHRYSQA